MLKRITIGSLLIILILSSFFTATGCSLMNNHQEDDSILPSEDASVNATLTEDYSDETNLYDPNITDSAYSVSPNASEYVRLQDEILQYPSQNDEWKYDVYETYIKVTEYVGTEIYDVIVPEEIDGLPVKIIGSTCFTIITPQKASFSPLWAVTLSHNIIAVEDHAFNAMEDLLWINFASDDKIVFGEAAFRYCINISRSYFNTSRRAKNPG